jgi:hypothetical protein
MPIAPVRASAGSALRTAGWLAMSRNAPKPPVEAGVAKRVICPPAGTASAESIWFSAMDYTGMFMMSR